LPSDNGDSEETPNDQSTYSGLFNKDPAGANESLPIGTTANSRAAAESTPLSPGVTLLNATNSALPNGAPGMSANGVSAPLRTGAGAFSALNNNPLGSKNPSASELDEEHNRKSRFGHPVLAALQNGSGASNNSEGSAFDNFMARMGAGGSPMAFAAAGGNFDLAYGLQGNASQKPLTIFEFASSQYKKAKTERKAFQKSRFTPKALHVQLSAE
ncbi:MAG: hypothetical protein EB078_07200, partial [Proteobacteria bacterium]|nr:hypothetical protein [Pseudomonadota bacterium]